MTEQYIENANELGTAIPKPGSRAMDTFKETCIRVRESRLEAIKKMMSDPGRHRVQDEKTNKEQIGRHTEHAGAIVDNDTRERIDDYAIKFKHQLEQAGCIGMERAYPLGGSEYAGENIQYLILEISARRKLLGIV